MSSKIEKVEYIIDTLSEHAREIIPGGSLVNKIINASRGFKEKRTLKFITEFKEIFESFIKNGGKFNEKNLTEEYFIDAFERICLKVNSTASEQKIKYFASILMKKAIEPDDDKMFLKFLGLIDTLNDQQILTLSKMKDYCDKNQNLPVQIHRVLAYILLDSEVDNSIGEFPEIHKDINELEHYILTTHNYNQELKDSGISLNQFRYYILELKNLGLIQEITNFNRVKKKDISHGYLLTSIGFEYLNFISKYGD